ncbi:shikimate kinase [Rubrobacter taiwanensis]|jgi:shikimate kinase|uniref:Shikimate kinase n=1 Tax=Rubrobacter taiwanensis TaxID=185139 RepID=A0A4R1BJB2_9ACTN|nr:shikimate kinase [Rubrobacter taiwanensis]TCJ17268.1 shikimate kinase [Rubrobacter taiwanensis]
MKSGPLAIVGYMGSGKSTVGRIVARQVGWEFVDLDEVVAERAGLSITEIFDSLGERAFRRLESEALGKMLGGERVVACGGGVVEEPRNRSLLSQVNTVFLWEDTEILWRRTRGTDRPLRGEDYEEFSRRYSERLPYYLEVAALQVEVYERPPEDVAREIVAWLRE